MQPGNWSALGMKMSMTLAELLTGLLGLLGSEAVYSTPRPAASRLYVFACKHSTGIKEY